MKIFSLSTNDCYKIAFTDVLTYTSLKQQHTIKLNSETLLTRTLTIPKSPLYSNIACGPKSTYFYTNKPFKLESPPMWTLCLNLRESGIEDFHSTVTIQVKKCVPFKGATLATRAVSKWGVVMVKLSGLSPCLLYSAFYFNSVVCCLLSVSY